jgi:hypothetical protein
MFLKIGTTTGMQNLGLKMFDFVSRSSGKAAKGNKSPHTVTVVEFS